MTFEEIWKQVKGLSDTAMAQVPGALKEDTRRKLSRKSPDEVAAIVQSAIDEVNGGSIEPLDILIKRQL
jgi:RNA-splicing ligase RtcB